MSYLETDELTFENQAFCSFCVAEARARWLKEINRDDEKGSVKATLCLSLTCRGAVRNLCLHHLQEICGVMRRKLNLNLVKEAVLDGTYNGEPVAFDSDGTLQPRTENG
jgi:hypothetical protein